MANTKAEPGKCFQARAWRIYKANSGWLDRLQFNKYLSWLYGLQLDADAAAKVMILFKGNYYSKDILEGQIDISDPFT